MTTTPGRIDWDELRYVLAVADAPSLAAAARTLGVNHTTVLRRVTAFESRLGVRLFDRLPSGYALTAAGEDLIGTARGLSEEVHSLERRLLGTDTRLEGGLRVTTTDTLMATLVPPLVAHFLGLHPAIAIEVTTTHAMADLSRREADVAIRPAADPPDHLVGRRVCDVAFAVFVARASPLSKVSSDWKALRWIAPGPALADTLAARWIATHAKESTIACRVDSMVAMAHAAEAGIGAAVLPCYLGDRREALVRLGAVIESERSALWVLMHKDLRQSARIREFSRFAADALRADVELLEGRAAAT